MSLVKLCSYQWQHLDKLLQIDSLIKYVAGAANLLPGMLGRIHHPVSAAPAATINIDTMELQVISAEEWKNNVCERLVEDVNSGPIVTIICEKAGVTNKAGNCTSQYLREKVHRKKIVRARLFRFDHGLQFRMDTGALCIPLDMQSNVTSQAHYSLLGGIHT